MRHLSTPEMRDCIDDCIECSTLCRECIQSCLSLGGDYVGAEHIRILMDCADVCQTAANLMLRESDFQADACRLCAALCKEAAISCRQLDGDELIVCAEQCEQCADSCETVAVSLTWAYGATTQTAASRIAPEH